MVYKFEIQIYKVFYIAIYRFENLNVFGMVYSSLKYLCSIVNTSSGNLKICTYLPWLIFKTLLPTV